LGTELFHADGKRTDRQTNMTKLMFVFALLRNPRPKKKTIYVLCEHNGISFMSEYN